MAVYAPVKPWQNYCFAGEEYRSGDRLMAEGTELGAVEIGVLAGQGRSEVSVYRRVRVLLLSTGDEVVLPGEKRKPGQIYDSNLHMLRARMRQWGAEVIHAAVMPDDADAVAEVIRSRIREADLAVTTGGVSVGKKDIMHDVFRLLDAKRLFWRVKIKPGMPALAGSLQDRPLICLSGNPYGAAANLELLVRPVFVRMSRRRSLEMRRKKAVLKNGYGKKSPVTRYVRAVYEDGQVRIADGSNDSGILSTMCGCNCLAEITEGSLEMTEGEQVWVMLL